MPTTIESLQVEIKSDSTNATTGIDALASSLTKLKTVLKNGLGLESVVKDVGSLSTAMSAVSDSAEKVDKLASSLQKLSNCSNLAFSSKVANQITKIGGAVQSLSGTNIGVLDNLARSLSSLSSASNVNLNRFISQIQRLPQAISAMNGMDMTSAKTKIQELSSALQSLSVIGKSNLSSYVTQLKKLPEAFNALNATDISGLTEKMRELASALAPLAQEMQSIANGFSAMPAKLQKLIQVTNRVAPANATATRSYTNLAAKLGLMTISIASVSRLLARCINESNEYIESMNLFTVSMGEYAEQANKYAAIVSEKMGIDPAEWMRNQGVFMTLATGFGVVSERANVMSQNLTQLGYDISSFYNLPIEQAMLKLQSGLAGELEPLRRIGYDLSYARLQQEAYNLGINKSITAMSQAEKAELRYYAIMTQVTQVHGDMARTLNAPANQLRVLKAQLIQCARAIGNLFIPMLNAILPVAIAVVKAIRMIAEAIASLFGIQLPEVDYDGLSSSFGGAADSVDDMESGLGGAAKKAKELKNILLGIDELTIISPPDDSTGGSGVGAGAGGAGGFDFDLPTYDFLKDAVDSRVNDIMKKIQPMLDWIKSHLDEILEVVAMIGTAFLEWKIAKGILNAIEKLRGLRGLDLSYKIAFAITGLGIFLDAWDKIKTAVKDIMDNGPNLENVTLLISGFAEGIGLAFLALGHVKLGGALFIISGIAGIVSAIEDIGKNGLNIENFTNVTRNIGLAISGLALFTKDKGKWFGIGLTISGISLLVQNFQSVVEAIRSGDWSGVDKVSLFAGALMTVMGVLLAIGKFKDMFDKIGGAKGVQDSTTVMKTFNDALGGEDSGGGASGGSGLFGTLKNLAKNLGIGLLIIGEVAGAAALIVGAIALLGVELDLVGQAWEPVIENGSVVAEGIGLGAAVLGAVGVATELLGQQGGVKLIANLGLGLAVLAEVGAAAILFAGEVIIVGELLQEVGDAWQPVIDNGGTVAAGIGLGVAVLVGVGVAAALLGTITMSTGGTLPLAIGIGTAVLVELGIATGLFIEEIVNTGKQLQEVGDAWQPVIDKGDTIAEGIGIGTGFLVAVGAAAAALGGLSLVSGMALPAAIAIGTGVLWELAQATMSFTNNMSDVADQMVVRLAPALEDFNEVLPGLSEDMENFKTYMSQFAGCVVEYSKDTMVSAIAEAADTIVEFFLGDPLEKMSDDVERVKDQAVDLNSNLMLANPELQTAIGLLTDYVGFVDRLAEIGGSGGTVELAESLKVNLKIVGSDIVTGFNEGIKEKYPELQKTITGWGEDTVKWFTKDGKVNKEEFSGYAEDIIKAFSDKVSSSYNSTKSPMVTWANNIKNWFSDSGSGNINKNAFQGYGADIVKGFNDGINANYNSSKTNIGYWTSGIKEWFTGNGYGNVNENAFEGYAKDSINGFNNGILSNYSSVKSPMNRLATEVKSSFTNIVNYDAFHTIGRDVVNGFNAGINDFYETSKSHMRTWANSAKTAYKNELDSNSPSKVFMAIGHDTVEGFNIGIRKYGQSTKNVVNSWANTITDTTPSIQFSVDTSALNYYTSEKFSRTMSANVSANQTAYTEFEDENLETTMQANNENLMSVVYAVGQQVVETLKENGDRPIVLDGRKVNSRVESEQSRANKMYGR